ncbi:MAG TPA: DUF2934 domain-containing protein [Terriglobia bacterium]|nr:DUF2934 domain-containing protein [Terriglobia bacterium]
MKQATAKKNQSIQTTPKPNILMGDDLAAMLELLEQSIARRAFEIYEARGGEHGRDQEDWLRAVEELMDPLPGNATEDGGSVTLRSFVPASQDVAVSIEPRRVIVWVDRQTKSGQAPQSERAARKMLQYEFPQLIDPAQSSVNLSGQILTITVPKAIEKQPSPSQSAA